MSNSTFSEKRQNITTITVVSLVLLVASITTWVVVKFYNFITSVLPFSGWISIFIVIGIIYMIFKYRKNISINKLLPEKTWWKGILTVSAIVLAGYFILRWWDNRPTSPDAPIQYVSHSVTTGTLQTQHVSTASEVTTVPRENISTPVPLALEHEYTLEPGTEYEWYNDSTKKYFLPVDCGTEMKLFVYTGDRSTHYIYEAERDTYGNVSEGKYDLVTPNRVPAGYFRIQLSTPDPIKVKYTAYLK